MQYAKTDPEPVSERTPRFRNIHISNVTAETKQAIFINGLAEMPVEDITFNDIQIDAQTGAVIREAKNIQFHNVRITTKEGSSIAGENVSGLVLDGVNTLNPVAGKPTIDLLNVQDVFLYNCFVLKETPVFLQVKGAKSRNIVLKNNNFTYVLKPLVKDETVTEAIVVE
jgi:hypothetical protein